MTKTATKTESEAIKSESVGQMIEIGRLEASPTNPRKRFPANSIDELAGSIREQGVIEPLIVRAFRPEYPQETQFEIVCGERRYRASTAAGLEKLPCIVRDLTDDQVLDIQIHENLHREDVHPMDEAYGYKFLQEKLECDLKELAARVGKSEKFVASRLKLNFLIDEAQADIEKGHLPLVYALEITKYPAAVQKSILDEGTYSRDSKWNGKKQEHDYFPIKEKIKPWPEFINFIQKNILGLLSAAPFDIKATNLRKDGLACVACPDRSGANAGLFDDDQVGKKDACLNPLCFREKSAQLVVITRERIAHEASINIKAVPMINLDAYSDRDGCLGKNSFTVVGKKPYKDYYGNISEKSCENAVTAINVGDGQYAKTYEICLPSSACKVHFKKTASSSSASGNSSSKSDAAELDIKRQRREELFDCKVADIARLRVFRHAGEIFAKSAQFTDTGTGFVPQLLTKLWLTSNNGDHNHTLNRVVRTLMCQITDSAPDAFGWSTWGSGVPDSKTPAGIELSKLTPINQCLILFFFVHGNKGHTYYDNYQSQKEVRQLADEYGLNYRLIDAQARLQVAEEKAKKHIETFKLYLATVEAGNEAPVPRIYSENWKPKD